MHSQLLGFGTQIAEQTKSVEEVQRDDRPGSSLEGILGMRKSTGEVEGWVKYLGILVVFAWGNSGWAGDFFGEGLLFTFLGDTMLSSV